MSRLHNIFDALVGLRKLLFTIGGLTLITLGMVVATAIFLSSWYFNAAVFSGDNLVAVYTSGFTYMAAMVGSYLAVNVCNKWVHKWINRRK